MDLNKDIAMIGLLETLINIQAHRNDPEMIQDIHATLTVPENSIIAGLPCLTAMISLLKKEKLLLMTPEIALMEQLSHLSECPELILCLPAEMSENETSTIMDNIPGGLHAACIREYEYPDSFRYDNGVILVFGFGNRNRVLIPDNICRMLDHFSGMPARRIMVLCDKGEEQRLLKGWQARNPAEIFSDLYEMEG